MDISNIESEIKQIKEFEKTVIRKRHRGIWLTFPLWKMSLIFMSFLLGLLYLNVYKSIFYIACLLILIFMVDRLYNDLVSDESSLLTDNFLTILSVIVPILLSLFNS